jgi:hypothetical protein
VTDENGLLKAGMQEMLKQFGTDGWKIGKGRF